MAVQPRLASTVMLLRDTPAGNSVEVFMVRRSVQSEFVPDVYVFPGGSVSADDRTAEQTEGICAPFTPPASDPEGRTALGTGTRAAAIREVFEEANILLAYRDHAILAITPESAARYTAYRQAFNDRQGSLVELARTEGLTLATDRLAYFAHWITPELMPKRYDTHFFLAATPPEQEALYDTFETSDGLWIEPGEALARFERQEFPIVFATYYQLRDLAAYRSVQEAIAATATRSIPTRTPIMEEQDGRRIVYLAEDPAGQWSM